MSVQRGASRQLALAEIRPTRNELMVSSTCARLRGTPSLKTTMDPCQLPIGGALAARGAGGANSTTALAVATSEAPTQDAGRRVRMAWTLPRYRLRTLPRGYDREPKSVVTIVTERPSYSPGARMK